MRSSAVDVTVGEGVHCGVVAGRGIWESVTSFRFLVPLELLQKKKKIFKEGGSFANRRSPAPRDQQVYLRMLTDKPAVTKPCVKRCPLCRWLQVSQIGLAPAHRAEASLEAMSPFQVGGLQPGHGHRSGSLTFTGNVPIQIRDIANYSHPHKPQLAISCSMGIHF